MAKIKTLDGGKVLDVPQVVAILYTIKKVKIIRKYIGIDKKENAEKFQRMLLKKTI
jgi:hypothetical protein